MNLTATERRRAKLMARKAKAAERARRVLRSLLTALDATTTYREPLTARTPRYKGASVLYGSKLALKQKPGSLLDADGKPTQFALTVEWSAQPGEIISSRGNRRTGAPVTRYMVRPDHSLGAI